MKNKNISDIFEEISDILSVSDKPTSRFEVRAYKRAALTIGTLQEDVSDIYRRGGINALMELPGIGKGLATEIEEYIKTGKISKYEELKKEYPIDFNDLLNIEGIGPKTAILLYKKLNITNLESLKKALEGHKIKDLPGFGVKSEQVIADGIRMHESNKGRILLSDGLNEAEKIISILSKSGKVEKVVISGSTRRMRETLGDLDILAISNYPEDVMNIFSNMEDVNGIVVKGPTKTTVSLNIETTCDLRVIEPHSFGAALQYFTGSKDHNIKVRKIAIEKGYKLNEYGLFDKSGKIISESDEKEIYNKLGMQYIPPEMREDRGEIELALKNQIPNLVDISDIKGDLHTHTKETDGINTIEEMAAYAIKKSYQYIATTNHTKSLKVAHGLTDEQFENYFNKVDILNDKLKGKLKILKGAEVDILKDGTLDLKDSTLDTMDCVVGAVHTNTNMDENAMTSRVLKAINTGYINILAHPTGRLINERDPYQIDLIKIAEACNNTKTALEINASPSRLDLNDTNILSTSKLNPLYSVDTDAHSTINMDFMKYGIGTARRGWLTKESVIDTFDLNKLLKFLKKEKKLTN